MANNSTALKDLLAYTRDGEWGQDSPADDRIEMLVIRGTDFEAVRYGDLTGVPTRFIPQHIARNKQLRPNDILIETAGGSKGRPTGKTLLITEQILGNSPLPVTCASFCRFLRVDQTAAEPEYVFWYLQHLYASGETYNYQVQHTGIARFQYTVFAENTQIPLPPLDEQREIARILGALDDKIDLNRRMNAALEATARALFQSWFVDFDPVRAKMDGRQPEGMDSETAALFPDAFEESALGWIPKGWRVGTVGDEFKITMGQSPPGETYNETGEGLPFYQGRRDFGFRFPTQRVYCTQPTRLAEAGDTLVSVRAPVGDLNMALDPCSIGRGVGAMRHRSSSRSFTYYAAHFLKPYFENYNGEGTVFGSINSADFRKIPFLQAPPALVEQFDHFISPIDDAIENNERSSVSLADTRDALLPKLISGEVRVREG